MSAYNMHNAVCIFWFNQLFEMETERERREKGFANEPWYRRGCLLIDGHGYGLLARGGLGGKGMGGNPHASLKSGDLDDRQ